MPLCGGHVTRLDIRARPHSECRSRPYGMQEFVVDGCTELAGGARFGVRGRGDGTPVGVVVSQGWGGVAKSI